MQRLSMALCPACECLNDPGARFCSACGSPLVMRCNACGAINVRSRPACHHCDAPLVFDEVPAGPSVPGRDHAAAPVVAYLGPGDDALADDWPLSFRSVLGPNPGPGRDRIGEREPQGGDVTVPMALQRSALDTVPAGLAPLPDTRADTLADTRAGPAATPPAAPAAPAATPTTPTTPAKRAGPPQAPAPASAAAATTAPARPPAASADAHALAPDPEAKAQRRALVRRSQLRRRQAGLTDAGAAPNDVLLLEADADARTVLREVLGLFGFRTHVAISVAEAEGMCARRGFVVALLGLGKDAEAATELCRRLHDTRRRRPLALIAMADATRHADRVRMQLAGADTTLTRPVGRGSLARALEACGVRLPSDPREGGAPTH